jgi:hypothetical protein
MRSAEAGGRRARRGRCTGDLHGRLLHLLPAPHPPLLPPPAFLKAYGLLPRLTGESLHGVALRGLRAQVGRAAGVGRGRAHTRETGGRGAGGTKAVGCWHCLCKFVQMQCKGDRALHTRALACASIRALMCVCTCVHVAGNPRMHARTLTAAVDDLGMEPPPTREPPVDSWDAILNACAAWGATSAAVPTAACIMLWGGEGSGTPSRPALCAALPPATTANLPWDATSPRHLRLHRAARRAMHTHRHVVAWREIHAPQRTPRCMGRSAAIRCQNRPAAPVAHP